MKFYVCSSVIMLAFASERGAERGAGCNRKGSSDGRTGKSARSHALAGSLVAIDLNIQVTLNKLTYLLT